MRWIMKRSSWILNDSPTGIESVGCQCSTLNGITKRAKEQAKALHRLPTEPKPSEANYNLSLGGLTAGGNLVQVLQKELPGPKVVTDVIADASDIGHAASRLLVSFAALAQ
ncbi:hypothetical protein C8R44DRAFT_728229 [Mycena epipterygia]|nr:hypothetical protein C8R44DRAFT_728229 [Mycena epipterygia]